MIKHIVMWKLKEDVGGVGKVENIAEMKERLEVLKDQIAEIKELEVGINTKQSDTAYDIVLLTSFGSQADLNSYQAHPEHRNVGRFIQDVTRERCIVDFEA